MSEHTATDGPAVTNVHVTEIHVSPAMMYEGAAELRDWDTGDLKPFAEDVVKLVYIAMRKAELGIK